MPTENKWEDKSRHVLPGRRIVEVRYVDDGTTVWPCGDNECNDAGELVVGNDGSE